MMPVAYFSAKISFKNLAKVGNGYVGNKCPRQEAVHDCSSLFC